MFPVFIFKAYIYYTGLIAEDARRGYEVANTIAPVDKPWWGTHENRSLIFLLVNLILCKCFRYQHVSFSFGEDLIKILRYVRPGFDNYDHFSNPNVFSCICCLTIFYIPKCIYNLPILKQKDINLSIHYWFSHVEQSIRNY